MGVMFCCVCVGMNGASWCNFYCTHKEIFCQCYNCYNEYSNWLHFISFLNRHKKLCVGGRGRHAPSLFRWVPVSFLQWMCMYIPVRKHTHTETHKPHQYSLSTSPLWMCHSRCLLVWLGADSIKPTSPPIALYAATLTILHNAHRL